ncbi:MAG: hypothetical protein JWO77_3053 [Ilumatobacteraceae bacterium]|nr:hypothetical protein [Ilumatobacteraceae bacterium]
MAVTHLFDRSVGSTDASASDVEDHASRVGRVALVTQGVLYVVVGLLALQVARGDHSAEPSQQGALESIARQPFGRIALAVVVLGLLAHAAWRGWLAVVGEPGDDDDAGSVAKRAANAGRAVVYLSFVAVAVRLLTEGGSGGSGSGGGGSGGDTAQKSTSTVLDWPGGPWLVVAAGLVFLGVAGWNVRKAVTRSFADDLDFSRVSSARKPWVCRLGTVGYLGRAAAFGLIGWFLIDAGRQHDPSESRGLDDALRELTTAPYGPWLLLLVAIGLAAFGAFRILDGLLRRDDALTHA